MIIILIRLNQHLNQIHNSDFILSIDHNNNKDKAYAIAGANDTDGGNHATATLTTPGFKGNEHPKECLIFWYNINTNGIDDALEVHKLDNDNNKVTNLWSLPSPGESGWQQGKVEVSSDGDKMFQVINNLYF